MGLGSQGRGGREGRTFHPGPWPPARHCSLPPRTQPAAPAMDRWYLGESPQPHASPLLRIGCRCLPHHVQGHHLLPRSAGIGGKQKPGQAAFLNKGISRWSPGHVVISTLRVSVPLGLGRQLVPKPPFLSLLLFICRNSKARLLGLNLAFPTS